VPGRGLRRIFAKIRTFAISASVRTRAETNLHVFDTPWPRQSTPGAQPRAPRAAPSQTRATARARSPVFALHTACQRSPEHPPPKTGQSSHSQPRPTLERDSTCLGETPRAKNRALPRQRHRFRVTGLHPIVGERRPGSTVSLSSIPCTGWLFSTPWSFSCPWIELYRRG
jgi:hypothetical protein